jgi:hypothetical protein
MFLRRNFIRVFYEGMLYLFLCFIEEFVYICIFVNGFIHVCFYAGILYTCVFTKKFLHICVFVNEFCTCLFVF